MKKFLALLSLCYFGCRPNQEATSESLGTSADALNMTPAQCQNGKSKHFLSHCADFLENKSALSREESVAIEKIFNLTFTTPTSVSDAKNSASTQCATVKSRVESKSITIDVPSKLGDDADQGLMCDFIGSANLYWGNKVYTYKKSAVVNNDVKNDQTRVNTDANVTANQSNVDPDYLFDVMDGKFVTFCSIQYENLKAQAKPYTLVGDVTKGKTLLSKALALVPSSYSPPEFNGISGNKCAKADAYFAEKYYSLSRGFYTLNDMCSLGVLKCD